MVIYFPVLRSIFCMVKTHKLRRARLQAGPMASGCCGWPRRPGPGTGPRGICNPDIFKEPDRRLRIQLDQDVDVAGALGLAAGDRAEQRRVANPAPVQLRLVGAQRGDDPFPVDAPIRPALASLAHLSVTWLAFVCFFTAVWL